MLREPLVILALLGIAVFGSYRAFKYGVGGARLWGFIPIVLILLGGLVAPFIVGFLQGLGVVEREGVGSEGIVWSVVGPFLLAVAMGVVLLVSFRPK
jgi:hypothetical protein